VSREKRFKSEPVLQEHWPRKGWFWRGVSIWRHPHTDQDRAQATIWRQHGPRMRAPPSRIAKAHFPARSVHWADQLGAHLECGHPASTDLDVGAVTGGKAVLPGHVGGADDRTAGGKPAKTVMWRPPSSFLSTTPHPRNLVWALMEWASPAPLPALDVLL